MGDARISRVDLPTFSTTLPSSSEAVFAIKIRECGEISKKNVSESMVAYVKTYLVRNEWKLGWSGIGRYYNRSDRQVRVLFARTIIEEHTAREEIEIDR
jgi:hypothetical protein